MLPSYILSRIKLLFIKWFIYYDKYVLYFALTPHDRKTLWNSWTWTMLPVFLSGRASGFDSVLPSGPDIAQFKQGVKTVAGKMAVLANGVMNTIQVRRHSPWSVWISSPASTRVFANFSVFARVSSGSLRLLLISSEKLAPTCGRHTN